MPMWRRTWRSSRRATFVRSCPLNRISPSLGSTSRLMQRMSVLLPVPDAPMTAAMPRVPISRLMSVRTGFPATYDFERWRTSSKSTFLGFRRCFRLALGLLLVGGPVEALAGALRHLAPDFPCRLVVDREEAVGAVER